MRTVDIPNAKSARADDPGADGAGGVTAVRRALQLLESFGVDDTYLTLAELTRRNAMPKTTILRLARTLAEMRYLVQREDAAWRLGPAAGWLGARYQAAFDVNNAVEPVLRNLSLQTAESATFYVREGDMRTCLVRVEGPQAIRHHIRVGESLPLDKGSPGRVILAFSGEPGAVYEKIRRTGYYISIGERNPEVASVSAPVFGMNWRLLGSVGISGPAARLPRTKLVAHAKHVVQAANQLSYALGGSKTPSVKHRQSAWHP